MIFGFPPFFGESPEEVFMNIVNYEQCLAFPEPGQGPDISREGEAIIRALLTEPDRRLGAKANKQKQTTKERSSFIFVTMSGRNQRNQNASVLRWVSVG
jgi:hypothetical protein